MAELVEDHGAKFIDVMDPDGRSVFRFYEVEFSLACAMDGERDVAGLVRWAQEELGVTPSATEVRSVIATLGDLGYLAPGDAQAADVSLASGVVVGVQPRLEITSEVVLGSPGSNARPGGAMPKAPDLALGAAGAGAAPRPRAPAEDIALGASGRRTADSGSDVSLDLSEHIAVKPADVKEAVRQSKVMAAVDVPKDLLELAPEKPAARPATPAPPAAAAKPPARPTPQPMPAMPSTAATPAMPSTAATPAMPSTAATPAMPSTAVTPVAVAAAVEKPRAVEAEAKGLAATGRKPPVELRPVPEKQSVVPPGPQRRVSPVLIVALILVGVGAGGFLLWKYVIDQTNGSDQASTNTVKPIATPPVPAPPPVPERPVLRGKVELAAGSTKTLLSVFPGTIEWIEAADKDVTSGDVVMKLVGLKQLEATVATLQKDVDKRIADIENIRKARDAAEAAGNANAKKTEQARLDAKDLALAAKQQLLADKKDKIEEFQVRAQIDGKVSPTAKPGQKVAENAPIMTIQPVPTPSVTFQVPDDTLLESGTLMSLSLVGAESGPKHIDCTVAESKAGMLRFTCPPGTAEGVAVTYQLP